MLKCRWGLMLLCHYCMHCILWSNLHNYMTCLCVILFNGQDLWRGYILDVSWYPFLFPRWCVYEFPSLDQLCSWKHKFSLDYLFEHKTKSFSIWVCWATYLGHICRLNGSIWFCYKSGGIYETMWKSSWSTYYIIAKPIPSPKLTHNIGYNQSLKQDFLFAW
jgi:hypothetical protein